MFGSLLSLFIAGASFATDQITKHIADTRLEGKEAGSFKTPDRNGQEKCSCGENKPGYSCADGSKKNSLISFQKAENSGFAGNRLEGHRSLVVAVSSLIFVVCVVMYAITLSKPAMYTLKAGIGLMMGGAAGNVYDRIVKGRVTDFIIFRPINKIVFNMADVFLLTGAVVSVLCELLQGTD